MKKIINTVERLVVDLLRNFPIIKMLVKRIYLLFFGVIGRFFVKDSIMLGQKNIEEIGKAGSETFKGYYDISPENSSGLIFVYSSVGATHKKPSVFNDIAIEIYKSEDLKTIFRKRITRAFNWQQGSRAHWLDQHRLIYNDFSAKKKKYISLIWNVSNDTIEREIDYPIECLSSKDEFLSINFKRLAFLRPDYGYFAHDYASYDMDNMDIDGIWNVKIDSGRGELIYSLDAIVNSGNNNFPINTKHKVNHLMVSPNGKYALVVHRYFNKKIRKGRLLLLHLDSTKIIEIPTGGIVSHYYWASNRKIIGYLNDSSRELKYYSIDIKTMKLDGIEYLNTLQTGDGHPTKVSEGLFVTDTYPNRWGIQELFLVDESKKLVKKLATLKHPLIFTGESRCDLHPVYCETSKKLYFDSVASGKRRMYRLSL